MTRRTVTGPGRRNVCFSDHEDGHAKYFEGSVPAPGTEQRVEFDNEVCREFQNGERNDEGHEHPPVDRRDCPGEEHKREGQVDGNSPWPGQAKHRNDDRHQHQKCEKEAEEPILAPETRHPAIYVSQVIFSFGTPGASYSLPRLIML
jgi:hypothetical protein